MASVTIVQIKHGRRENDVLDKESDGIVSPSPCTFLLIPRYRWCWICIDHWWCRWDLRWCRWRFGLLKSIWLIRNTLFHTTCFHVGVAHTIFKSIRTNIVCYCTNSGIIHRFAIVRIFSCTFWCNTLKSVGQTLFILSHTSHSCAQALDPIKETFPNRKNARRMRVKSFSSWMEILKGKRFCRCKPPAFPFFPHPRPSPSERDDLAQFPLLCRRRVRGWGIIYNGE